MHLLFILSFTLVQTNLLWYILSVTITLLLKHSLELLDRITSFFFFKSCNDCLLNREQGLRLVNKISKALWSGWPIISDLFKSCKISALISYLKLTHKWNIAFPAVLLLLAEISEFLYRLDFKLTVVHSHI